MKTSPRAPLLFCTLGLLAAIGPAVSLAQVPTAPTITTQPASLSVATGTAATFTVTATGSMPLSYQWAKGGAMIASATSATYTINSVTTSDAGSYAVTVTNPAGSVTSDVAALVVTPLIGGPPTISTQPTSQNVSAGSSVTFNVTATGSGPITYSWFKESRLLSLGSASSLTIPKVAAADAGMYHVVVTNVGGSVTSESVALTVAAPLLPPPPPPR